MGITSKSLAKLRSKNKKLEEQVGAKKELLQLEQDRLKLAKQNKQLLKEISRSPSEKVARQVLKDFGRGSFIAGKTIGKGLVNYGRFLDKQQTQNRRKAKTLKKTIRRKTTPRKTRRR